MSSRFSVSALHAGPRDAYPDACEPINARYDGFVLGASGIRRSAAVKDDEVVEDQGAVKVG
jgi:hypothetical protein